MAKRKKKLGDADFPGLHANHRGRMRRRILTHGAATLAPHELLEVLLYTPIARQNTNGTAHRLVRHFGSIEQALHAPTEELERISGVGERSAQFLRDVGRIVDAYAAAKRRGRILLDNSALARQLASGYFAASPDAKCVLFSLDEAMRLLASTAVPEPTTQALIVACASSHATRVVIALRGEGSSEAPSHSEAETFGLLRSVLSLLNVVLLDIVVVDGAAVRTYRERAELSVCVRYDAESRLKADSLHFSSGRSAVRFADIVSGGAGERSESDADGDASQPDEADGFDGEAAAAFAAVGDVAASSATDADDDSFSDAEIDPEEIYETVVEPLGTVGQLGSMEEVTPPEADAFADLLGDADEEPF